MSQDHCRMHQVFCVMPLATATGTTGATAGGVTTGVTSGGGTIWHHFAGPRTGMPITLTKFCLQRLR